MAEPAEATANDAPSESHSFAAGAPDRDVASGAPLAPDQDPAAQEEPALVVGSELDVGTSVPADIPGVAPRVPQESTAPAPEAPAEPTDGVADPAEVEHPTTAEADQDHAVLASQPAVAVPPAAPGEEAAAVAVADAGQAPADAPPEQAALQAVAALRAAVMPLQQLAERGDLRPTLTMVPAQEPAAEPPAPPPVLDTQIVLPAPARLEATARVEPAAELRGAAWADEPPRPSRREWAGPFFVGLGAVAVVAFAAMAFVGWSSSKPAALANKTSPQPSLAGAGKPSSPAVDAAADAAAEAAARLLASTPDRAARKPDGKAAETVVSTVSPLPPARPVREAPPPRPPVAVAQPRPPAAVTAAPISPQPAAPRRPVDPVANAGLAAPSPQSAEAVRPRAVQPTPPPVLPRECTAAMDALGICQTGSKPSGS